MGLVVLEVPFGAVGPSLTWPVVWVIWTAEARASEQPSHGTVGCGVSWLASGSRSLQRTHPRWPPGGRLGGMAVFRVGDTGKSRDGAPRALSAALRDGSAATARSNLPSAGASLAAGSGKRGRRSRRFSLG